MYTSLHQRHTSKLTSVSTESKHSCLRLLTHDCTWTRLLRFSDTNVPGVISFLTALHCHWKDRQCRLTFAALLLHTSFNKDKMSHKKKTVVKSSTSKQCWRIKGTNKSTENQAVNRTLVRGRKMGMELCFQDLSFTSQNAWLWKLILLSHEAQWGPQNIFNTPIMNNPVATLHW